VDIKESIKSVALEFFQSSKTFNQDLSVKYKSLTRLCTSREALDKRSDKNTYWFCKFKVDPKITTNFINTCSNASRGSNTSDYSDQRVYSDNELKEFDRWLGNKNTRPCETIERLVKQLVSQLVKQLV